jgi:hypothetical protein
LPGAPRPASPLLAKTPLLDAGAAGSPEAGYLARGKEAEAISAFWGYLLLIVLVGLGFWLFFSAKAVITAVVILSFAASQAFGKRGDADTGNSADVRVQALRTEHARELTGEPPTN